MNCDGMTPIVQLIRLTFRKGLWTWGPRDDFEEIARLVGDEDWDWEHASEQLKKVRSGTMSE